MTDPFPWWINLINFIISCIYTAVICRLLSRFLSLKTHKWVSVLLYFLLLLCSDAIIFSEETTGALTLFFLFFSGVFLCSKDSFLIRLSVSLVFYPIVVSVNYLTQDLGFTVWMYGFETTMTPVAEHLLHTATIALRIPVWMCIYHGTKNWISGVCSSLSRHMWYLIDVICLASSLGVVTLIYHSSTFNSYTSWPACMACILTHLGICRLCFCFAESTRTSLEVKLLKLQKNYYSELEAGQKKVRKLQHDMKNHLSVIQTLLEQDKKEQAIAYLRRLSAEPLQELRFFCENPMVNALLNAQHQLAQKHEISCTFDLQLPENISIDAVSLCSLIGNTMDNAIEACCRIPNSAGRHILLKVRCTDVFFSFFVENSKQDPVIRQGSLFQTSKKEKAAHGFGLQIVRDTVNRYHGTMEVTYTPDTFSVTIGIPLSAGINPQIR